MENRDFRDRLRNHTREPNPVAWEQMDALLNSLPEKEDEKKKRRVFWWFIFGAGVLALVIGALLNREQLKFGQSNKALSKTEILTQTENETVVELSEREVSDVLENDTETKTDNSNLSTNENDLDQGIMSVETNLEASDEIALVGAQNSSDVSSGNQTEREDININNPPVKNNSEMSNPEDGENITFRTVEQEVQTPATDNQSRDSNTTLEEINESSEREEGIEKKLENSTKENEESLAEYEKAVIENPGEGEIINPTSMAENTANSKSLNEKNEFSLNVPIEDTEESRTLLSQIDRLVLPSRIVFPLDDVVGPSMPEIEIVKPRLFDVFVGGGFASFNSNPGYIVKLGADYEVDRILDLEGNISYSYGSEQNVLSGQPFTFERQFDLSLLVHFNFKKNKNRRFSFFGGVGYAIYSGERVIDIDPLNIDVRDHNGRSFHLGFDYKFRFRKYNLLGLRLGVISYDDAVTYSSVRFIQEF